MQCSNKHRLHHHHGFTLLTRVLRGTMAVEVMKLGPWCTTVDSGLGRTDGMMEINIVHGQKILWICPESMELDL